MPVPLPYLQSNASIAVLFDGKPFAGAKLEIRNTLSPQTLMHLVTDAGGGAVLPNLPSGGYWMDAFLPSTSNPSVTFNFCVCPCHENELLETEMLIFQDLNGTVRMLDRSAAALKEISMDLAPNRNPGWVRFINNAERERVPVHLANFSLLVEDPTTAVIPNATVYVVRKGSQGKETLIIASTDAAGRFKANLPAGDYSVIVSAPGFASQAIPVSIDSKGIGEDLQMHLNVGST